MTTNIRDLREQKRLGQFTVSQAAELGFSAYVRIESGTGKTTPEDVAHVLKVLRGMPDGTRKMGWGRPFNDPVKRAAVAAARENGQSVAEAVAWGKATEIAVEETPKARDARKARERRAAKKAEAERVVREDLL